MLDISSLGDAADVKFGNFGKFQDTERFLIPCPRHVSSRLPLAVKPASTPRSLVHTHTHKNLERFSTCWYNPFCYVCLGCCAADFGSFGGTYELPCTLKYAHYTCTYALCVPSSSFFFTLFCLPFFTWQQLRQTALFTVPSVPAVTGWHAIPERHSFC